MVEMSKKHKKGSISEEDMSILLQRYSPMTVLALLQEVAQVPGVKIDWNSLVKKTATGISNAREYQMLWRHLAYRDSLLDVLKDGAEPLDNDSDLEYELEALPAVSSEASAEAAACVKVLIASGMPIGSTIEAPLTINIPNGQSSRVPSDNSQVASFKQGTIITVPVSVQKQPLPTLTSGEGLDTNGSASGSLPARRKRKPWSEAEDLELIAAVQKCGEGNWANILKGDFKSDRTASQLSQRWAIIRKRQGNMNIGGGSQLSEAQLAARRAVSLALNMPMGDNLKATSISMAGTNSHITPSNSVQHTAGEASSVGSQSQHPPQQDSVQPVALRTGTSGPLSKSRVPPKKPSPKSNLSPDSLVKAAAVAAGARIATPSDAASLLKAAQAKNAVHIIPGGGSLMKSSVAGNGNPLPPNVHYIRTGLAATHSTYSNVPPNASRAGGTLQVQVPALKPAALTVQLNPTSTAPELNASSEVINAATFISTIELEVNTAEDVMLGSGNELKEDRDAVAGCAPTQLVQEDQVAFSGNALTEQVQEDQASFSGNAPDEQVQESESSVLGYALKEHIQEDQASFLSKNPNTLVIENQTTLPISEAMLKSQKDFAAESICSSCADTAGNGHMIMIGNQVVAEYKSTNDDTMMDFPGEDASENQSAVKNICGNEIVNGEQEELTSMVVDECDEKVELPCKSAAGPQTVEEEK
ncbi:unnamed protein product [Ilex paraguariensis]|uniref:Uncharacterized protein n=1 Tax=Ilex paraguariensis TaxID=185542 RepID=A0ABC8T2M0_9AQUA